MIKHLQYLLQRCKCIHKIIQKKFESQTFKQNNSLEDNFLECDLLILKNTLYNSFFSNEIRIKV